MALVYRRSQIRVIQTDPLPSRRCLRRAKQDVKQYLAEVVARGLAAAGRASRWAGARAVDPPAVSALRPAKLLRLVLEDDVVVPVRVEGRVEVDQINALVGDVAAEDVEVVAVVEEFGVDRGLLEELRAYRREYGVLSRPRFTVRPAPRSGTWVLGADAQQLSSWRLLAQRTN